MANEMSQDKENDSGFLDQLEKQLLGDTMHNSFDPSSRDVVRNAVEVPCTSSEVMKKFKEFDNTIEMVGFIDKVEESRRTGRNNLLLFKFVIDNGDGERVQVVAWNEQVERVEAVVRKDMIIHLEGVYAVKPKEGFPTKSTINLEFRIESQTQINILGKRERDSGNPVPKPSTSAAKLFDIADIGSSIQYSQVEGYIKINFATVTPHGPGGRPYGSGSITNGHFMLRIRITDFNDEELEFNKGDHVRARGFMRRSANPPFFSVNSLHDIDVIDSTQMEFVQLLRGTNEIDIKHGAGAQVNALEASGPKAKKTKND